MCVKWTNSGKYLASCSDDLMIFIYHLVQGGPSRSEVGFGSGPTTENVENWQRWRTLKHHNLDVVDLAWSPDDKFLVSCR